MLSHAPFDGSERAFGEVLDYLSRTYRLYGRLQNWSLNRFGNWRFGATPSGSRPTRSSSSATCTYGERGPTSSEWWSERAGER